MHFPQAQLDSTVPEGAGGQRGGGGGRREEFGPVDATGGAPTKAEGKKKKADEPLGFRQRKRRSA